MIIMSPIFLALILFMAQNIFSQNCPLSLDQLNNGTPEEFVAKLGPIFEHSLWVAQTVVSKRPFANVDELYRAMIRAVSDAGKAKQLELIRAHPDLAAKVKLTDSSTSEQTNAGLNSLTERQISEFQSLNSAYKSRFGFPFILALRDQTGGVEGILAEFRRRMANSEEAEIGEALAQIGRIAKHRLEDKFGQKI